MMEVEISERITMLRDNLSRLRRETGKEIKVNQA
jgi:hypothetical protein